MIFPQIARTANDTAHGPESLVVGSYFRNAHLDVLAGVDHLMEQGIVDGDKMVEMGWSAGGHRTNKIITFTDRFKAAASGVGAVNWVSMYGQSDVRANLTPHSLPGASCISQVPHSQARKLTPQ